MRKWIFLVASFYFSADSFCQNNQKLDSFWNIFRNAVLENDFTKLDSLTDFPLIIKGDLDSDTAKEIRHNKFEFVFGVYLKQANENHTGTDFDDIREKKMISEKENDSSKKYVRISDMVFEKIKENWKLIMVYIDKEDQKENNIN